MKKVPVKSIVAIGIGAALFFVLGRFVSIPTPVPNTNFTSQYGLLAVLSVAYGPIAGALIGLIGHALIDFSYGWGIWWSWVIASAVYGLLVGLFAKILKIKADEVSKKNLIKFNVIQVLSHVACWGVVAPALDIAIYQEPVEKLFAQGVTSAIFNAIATAVIGSLLIVALSAAKPKAGSLNKE